MHENFENGTETITSSITAVNNKRKEKNKTKKIIIIQRDAENNERSSPDYAYRS